MMGNSWSDRPDVGERLEHREVAEVGVTLPRALEPLEPLGDLAHVAHHLQQLLADAPEDVLRDHALRQRQVPQVEESQRLFLVSERVVVRPEHVLARDLAEGLEQVLYSRAEASLPTCSGALPTSNSPTPRMSTTSIEWCATTARPDSVTIVGCGTPPGVADLLQREDDAVGVLLLAVVVVHRRGEVALRAVVVDAQAAAGVEILESARPAGRSPLENRPARGARSSRRGSPRSGCPGGSAPARSSSAGRWRAES